MSQPYLGQIIQGGWNFAPRGYMTCSGQLLPIAQYDALFALLGTTFGGDGVSTFGLPGLSGRTMLGRGNGPGLTPRTLGEAAGTEQVTLNSNQMPSHGHTATFNSTSTLKVAQATATKQQPDAAGYLLGSGADGAVTPHAIPKIYAPAGSTPTVALGGINVAGTVAVGSAGGGQPHENMQPYLVINQVIAVEGVFPSRN